MKAKIGLISALRSTTPTHWKDSLLLMAFTQIGGLAPLWIGALIMRASHQTPYLIDFARNGEFALYTAALLAPTLYLVVQEHAETQFAGRSTFVLACVVGLLLAVATYTLAAPEMRKSVGASLDRDFIGTITLTFFLVSLVMSVAITALDNARENPGVDVIVRRQQS